MQVFNILSCIVAYLAISSGLKVVSKVKNLFSYIKHVIPVRPKSPPVARSSDDQLLKSSEQVSDIEDDGYSYRQKSDPLRSWWRKNVYRTKPGSLILVRSGQTAIDYTNTFIGWVDADLAEDGVLQAEHAADLLLERGYRVDVVYTSRLKRAIRAAWIMVRYIFKRTVALCINLNCLVNISNAPVAYRFKSNLQACFQKLAT